MAGGIARVVGCHEKSIGARVHKRQQAAANATAAEKRYEENQRRKKLGWQPLEDNDDNVQLATSSNRRVELTAAQRKERARRMRKEAQFLGTENAASATQDLPKQFVQHMHWRMDQEDAEAERERSVRCLVRGRRGIPNRLARAARTQEAERIQADKANLATGKNSAGGPTKSLSLAERLRVVRAEANAVGSAGAQWQVVHTLYLRPLY